jgi:hypothetical protein
MIDGQDDLTQKGHRSVGRLSVPPDFVAETTHLYGAFRQVAESFEHPREVVEELVRDLPAGIRSSPAFLDVMTRMWRYDYGEAFDRMPNDQTVSGTNRWPAVIFLYVASFAAHLRLDSEQLKVWLARLEDPAKHLSVVIEMRPIINVPPDVPAQFEVAGRGEGNKTLDWIISPPDKRPILVDVKDRTVSLLKHLAQIMPAMQEGIDPPVPTAPDPKDLFRDTVTKFRAVDRTVQLQGAWIHAGVKEDRAKLLAYFDSLDQGRFHFAILGGWEPDATILARSEADRDYIAETLCIEPSDRFYSDEYSDSAKFRAKST